MVHRATACRSIDELPRYAGDFLTLPPLERFEITSEATDLLWIPSETVFVKILLYMRELTLRPISIGRLVALLSKTTIHQLLIVVRTGL
jgi:hypothetical protein